MPLLSSSRRRGLLAGGLLILAGSSVAVAATPENGEVSKASPKIEWKGEVTGSYANRIPVLLTEDDSVPCGPQTCDMFALNVKESDDLTITADAPEGTSTDGSSGSQVTLRIRKPDGSVSVHTTDTAGASPQKPLVVKLKKAPAGAYEIEYFNYFLPSAGAIPYTATATLGAPTAAPAPVNQGAGEQPATTPSTSEPGAGGTAPGPQSGAQEAITVNVKAGKLSARKIKKSRKLAATVSVSREVQKVTATLKKGKKVIGKGKLGRVQGSAKLTIKLAKKAAKRLKKGTYALTVAASDNAGSTGIRTIKLKVRK